MKITANFHKKAPVPGIEYGSQGYSCEIQIEPPPEVQQDRDKLRNYIEGLYDECRTRVEDQFQEHAKPGRAEPVDRQAPERRPYRRDASSRNSRSAFRHHNGNGRRQSGRNAQNGHNQNGGTSEASPKQLNYLRSLANEDGMGYRGLADMAKDTFGKDVLHLSKREASQLIDELRPEDRE